MTDQTTRPVPRGLNPMGLQPPQIVVRSGHRHLMAFPAGLFLVTDPAGIIRLRAERTMPPRPVLRVTRGRGFRIHIHMAGGARQPPPVRLVAHLHLGLTRHLRNPIQGLIHELPVTVRTPVCQRGGVLEYSLPLIGNFSRLIQGQLAQILDFMAHPAGLRVNLLGLDPLFMTLLTGSVRGSGKAAVSQFPMTIGTGHSIVCHVQIMTEGQFVAILFVTARHQQHQHQTNGRFLKN